MASTKVRKRVPFSLVPTLKIIQKYYNVEYVREGMYIVGHSEKTPNNKSTIKIESQ